MNNAIDKLNEFLENYINEYQEYQETHTDAGNNYSHMPREGSWCYNNCDDRLKTFIIDKEIDTKELDFDTISDLVLDNFAMVSNHMFSSIKEDVFYIASYPVGEIENQIELSTIKENTGNNWTLKRLKAVALKVECTLKVDRDSVCTYSVSDIYWSAQIDANSIQELINDY